MRRLSPWSHRNFFFASAYSAGGAECNPTIIVHDGYGGAHGTGEDNLKGVGERYCYQGGYFTGAAA